MAVVDGRVENVDTGARGKVYPKTSVMTHAQQAVIRLCIAHHLCEHGVSYFPTPIIV
jgi:hypothetical protein